MSGLTDSGHKFSLFICSSLERTENSRSHRRFWDEFQGVPDLNLALMTVWAGLKLQRCPLTLWSGRNRGHSLYLPCYGVKQYFKFTEKPYFSIYGRWNALNLLSQWRFSVACLTLIVLGGGQNTPYNAKFIEKCPCLHNNNNDLIK